MVTEGQRGILVVVTIIAILATVFGLAAYISGHDALVPNFQPLVELRDVQFEEGYLNVTITNHDPRDYTVNEVIVYQDHSSTILTDEIVNTPISGNETISIYVNLNWTSRCEYGLRLKTTGGDVGTWSLRAP